MSYTIVSEYIDGTPRKSWKCDLIEQTDELLVFLGIFDRQVEHSQLGRILKGTISYEYYWHDRWYNVFRFHEPDGAFRNFYCNINMPPVLDGNTLQYVDLDLDVLVDPSWQTTILDRDEFESNARKFNYPDDLRRSALLALDDLLAVIARRDFPFDRVHDPAFTAR